MTAYPLPARLAIALSGWLLARAGVEWQLRPPRDKRGRFRPRDGGGYGLPKSIPHHVADLMHDMGVTAEMYKTAAVALKLPDDFEDVAALELCLREWIYRNMDHWVNGKGRGVHGVMQALMCTWAITLYKFKPPKRMRGWSERFQRVADLGNESVVGEGLAPSRCVDQSNGLIYHRDTETLRNAAALWNETTNAGYGNYSSQPLPQANCNAFAPGACEQDADLAHPAQDFSMSRCLGGENTGDTSTTAGGRKALPYGVLRGPPNPPLTPTHCTLKI